MEVNNLVCTKVVGSGVFSTDHKKLQFSSNFTTISDGVHERKYTIGHNYKVTTVQT